MDFDETPAEAAFRMEARAFLQAFAPPKGGADDFATAYQNGVLPEGTYVKYCKDWQRVLAEHGWSGIMWPQEYGGRGGTSMEAGIFIEEQSHFGVSTSIFSVGIGMVGPTIIAHGTDEQRRRFLPPLLRGEEVWCQLFSEPDAGSDLAGLTTRAVHKEDAWVVNGQKVWTSGAAFSDFGILLARTDPSQPKHRGITFFLCDMNGAGVDVHPIKQMNGGDRFNQVFLADVSIPQDRILGAVNGGWGVAMTTLANERALIGESRGGLTWEHLVELARVRRRQNDPTIRQSLADAYAKGEILRYLGLRVKTATSKGHAPGAEANTMKLLTAQYFKLLSEVGLAIEGPAGMLSGSAAPLEGAAQQAFLTAPSIRIAGGSDEIQRNIIGERVLGLPRESRSDKDTPFNEATPRAN